MDKAESAIDKFLDLMDAKFSTEEEAHRYSIPKGHFDSRETRYLIGLKLLRRESGVIRVTDSGVTFWREWSKVRKVARQRKERRFY